MTTQTSNQSALTPAVVAKQLHEIIAGFETFVAPALEEKESQHAGAACDMLMSQLKVLANELAEGGGDVQ